MSNAESDCQMCGKCCQYEIPITILDIHRMGEYLNIPASIVFEKYIQREVSARSGLFMITKNTQRECVFLNNDKQCSIHNAKPRGCYFYKCSPNSSTDTIPWTAKCTDEASRAMLWEQSIAIMVTKAYAGDYGTAWNEVAYHKAISSILKNILNSDTQTLKLAMGPDNIPMAMIYDCSECETQGACAVETPITLDDIQCMVRNLGISWQVFFGEKIDPLPSIMTGGLKLIRAIHCVFYEPDKHCTIRETRPMHCRFTPCPGRVQNKEAITCLYLGSGTVEEQFRHQIALDVTRQYVGEYGIEYDESAVTKSLQVIDRLVEDRAALEDFCNSIAPFRYVDDTLPFKNPDY